MLTGARDWKGQDFVWALKDKLVPSPKKFLPSPLSSLFLELTDVWGSVTAGMIDRSNGEIAAQALGRWRRAARVSGSDRPTTELSGTVANHKRKK